MRLMSSPSSSHSENTPHCRVDKGKRRAQDVNEHTPLLPPPILPPQDPTNDPAFSGDTDTDSDAARLRAKLISVFLISLCLCILSLIALAFCVWSYSSTVSHISVDELLNRGLVFQGPNRVEVFNATEEGILVNVHFQIGVDAGSIIGVDSDKEHPDGLLRSLWKGLGRWGVRRLDRVSVNLTTIHLESIDDSCTLASIDAPLISLPLTANPPRDMSWLTNMSTPLFVKPTTNGTALTSFLRDSWEHAALSIQVNVDRAVIRGGDLYESGWRKNLVRRLEPLTTTLHLKIPAVPGLPHPGHHAPLPSLPKLLTLTSFGVMTQDDHLSVYANATLVNPLPPTFDFSSPTLPFTISLPSNSPTSHIDIASVNTAPFIFTHPNITLNVSGNVCNLSSSTIPALSLFLNRYLSGRPNPIIISTPLLRAVPIQMDFPALDPRPQVLHDVSIHDMKVRPSGGSFLASGTVFARVVLPKGMHIALDVHKILPDVLIFDGEVPADLPISNARFHQPDSLPERAFGHIRPDDWLLALSVPADSTEGEGAAYIITAKVSDVPLEVLPGRQKEFRNFVSKVLFGSDGAVAGLLGSAAVGVDIHGLPVHGPSGVEDMELDGLPFRGSTRVGKRDLIHMALHVMGVPFQI